MEKTRVYKKQEIHDKLVEKTLIEVIKILEAKGYNPINQISGYLMSGDLGYITSYKNARGMLSEFERDEILDVLLRKYVK